MVYELTRSFSIFFKGVEKKNNDLRRFFHRKINRWDAATNPLLVEKRQELWGSVKERRNTLKRHVILGGRRETRLQERFQEFLALASGR